VLLIVEVVSRGSASEREDRTRKLTEYSRAGILKVDVPLNVAIDLRDLVAWRRDHG
jgi:Uma2 family endonuclease